MTTNGYVADELGWPITSQTTPISTFFAAFHIFVVAERRYFKFGTQVDYSYSQPTDDKTSLEGAWLWSRDQSPKTSSEHLKLETSKFKHLHWLAMW